jgi:hypothetical protein
VVVGQEVGTSATSETREGEGERENGEDGNGSNDIGRFGALLCAGYGSAMHTYMVEWREARRY